ncbi:LOW QUALITY PROTEIN: acyl-coenzyme A thioesterase 1-like [Ctenodactylus gundi]
MAPTLTVEPAGRSCWDEPVRIAVRGLAPEQPVTLRAALRDEKGALFRAHARYRADAAGRLDLARAPALGGSFAGLEPMGLIWAMEPDKPFWRLIKRDVRTPFVVQLEVLDGHEPDGGRLLARAEHERHFLPPGVRRVPVREGRVRATLFLPPGEPTDAPVLVACADSRAFAVFLTLPGASEGPGVGLLGISKEGELCLSMASFLKNITAAVIINGPVASTSIHLHYKDETLPPLSGNLNRVKVTKDGVKDIRNILNSPLETGSKSFIPVERSDAAFLFLVGQDDHNWKSEFCANEACKCLQAHGKKKPQIICYPETGHTIDPPYFPVCFALVLRLVNSPILYGGEPRVHAMAHVDAWKQLQAFFHRHLSGEKMTIPAKL